MKKIDCRACKNNEKIDEHGIEKLVSLREIEIELKVRLLRAVFEVFFFVNHSINKKFSSH